MIKTVRETLSWDVPIIMNEGSGAPAIAPLVGANNLVGIVSSTIANTSSYIDLPFSKEMEPIFNQYEPGAPAGSWDLLAPSGMLTAYTFVGILKLAGPDLTRESLERGGRARL